MGWIDSHAHLTFPELGGQVEDVLARCGEAGVERVITIGTDLSDARAAIALAGRYPAQVSVAAGIHPHESEKVSAAQCAEMLALWREAPVVAFGEMGLDYFHDFADRKAQRRVFALQLEAAAGLGKPIIIHCRDALDDAVSMLVEHGFADRPVVFHCFSDGPEEAGVIRNHGWRLSFTGIVTFPKTALLQDVARAYPLDALMIETDSPYLSPVPVRGRRPNEPAHVVHVGRFLADLRGEPLEVILEHTRRNTLSFFGLPDGG